MTGKIVFIGEDLASCDGVSRVMTLWSNYFSSHDYNVEIITTGNDDPCLALGDKVIRTHIGFVFGKKITKILAVPLNIFKMYFFLKKRKGATVIFNRALYIEPIFFLRKLGLFKESNLVYFNHGGISDFSAFFLSRSSVAHRVKMMAEGFDFIVSLWGDPKDFPIQNTKAKNIIIPNPISFDCENVAYGEKEKTVLFVGRVVAVKGVEKIIEVWKELFHEFPDWNLRIVGDGKDKEKFEQLTEKYGMTSLKFEGASSHVKQFYKQADIFLFPSFWYEGMPMVLLEAMACKVAVIASDQDAHKNLIEGNGNGILVDATDNEAMIKELRNLILNTKLRKSMADKAYAYVQSYNIDEIEKRWEGILSR